MAVAILSVGIVAVLEALSICARVSGLSHDTVGAVLLSQDLMQKLEFNAAQSPLRDEVIKDKSGKFDWEQSIAFDPGLDLYNVSLAINWQRQNREEKFNIEAYLRK